MEVSLSKAPLRSISGQRVLTSDEDDICVSSSGTGFSCIPGSDTTDAFSPTVDRAAGRVRLRVPPGLEAGDLIDCQRFAPIGPGQRNRKAGSADLRRWKPPGRQLYSGN